MSYDLAVYLPEALDAEVLSALVDASPGLQLEEIADGSADGPQNWHILRGKKAAYCFTLEGPYLVEPEDVPYEATAAVLGGRGTESYGSCQEEAARLRESGAAALRARSAAMHAGAATGWRVERGFQRGPYREGHVLVLFGRRPAAVGWLIVDRGRPPAEILEFVRHL